MTVLVVDDNEPNLYQLQVLLGGNGYQVVTASNGAEALAKARQHPPDLVVSDILMPVMDGFTLCREWKQDERLRRIPFVFYTATYTDDRDREFGLSLGAEQFLVKPEEPDVFIGKMREVIERVQRPTAPPVPAATNAPIRLPVEAPEEEEAVYLKQYNEVLIRKLEAKMQQLEQANRELERDITERKRAEDELRRSTEQLRALAVHLQSVREQERTRIAREIHDQLGQMLTGLRMELRSLEKRLADSGAGPTASLQEKLEEMKGLTDATISAVQKLSHELRPGALDDLGLVAALQQEARSFEERSGVRCELALPDEPLALDRERSTVMFRIFQEILTNVARHASATNVRVHLETNGGMVALVVADNGRGIAAPEIASPKSLGLLGMSERAAAVGGAVLFRGTPGKGTTVTVRVPR